MRMLSVALLCVLALVGHICPVFAQEPVTWVQDIRIGQENGRTRIVLDLEGNVNHRWFTLPTPPRVVVDFPAIEFRKPVNEVALPEGSIVTALRAGAFRAGTTRMVLDLKQAARVSVFGIPGNTQRGPRVVIDVVPPKPGQAPTNVPPPAEVVTTTPFTPGKPTQSAAPVVPRQVVQADAGPITIVLDAGHGGVDPGACGKRIRLCEKGLTLYMAKKVQQHLKQKGYKVLLSRDRDVYVGLADRVRFAQRNNANLFVSLHADSHPNAKVEGATVYMVSEKASDREAQRLANSENEGDMLAGVDISHESREVQNILVSLAQRDTMNHSSYLAQSMILEMDKVADLRKKTPLFAGFKVLKAPDIPSILVEMGYLSNAREERNLSNSAYRDKLARALAAGVERYIRTHLK
ncbi:MAG: N-acetylmuramoyl-L-alanine amidase [Pseudomonadaceae bacterium]|nr:N-acetylmuramoyl-L-alanine amidase [Pseudomonadaceae bacterium]